MLITTDPHLYARQLAAYETTAQFSPQFIPRPPQEARRSPKPARWPRFLRKCDLAEYLGVSTGTIDTWLESYLLPAATVSPTNRLKRWDRHRLDEHLDQIDGLTATEANSADAVLAKYKLKSEQGGD